MSLDLKKKERNPNKENPSHDVGDFFSEKNKENQPHDIINMQWEAPEFEIYSKGMVWYLFAILILVAIVLYAIIIESPIMAITFILIGVVGYMYLQKSPKTVTFSITEDGVRADNELYEVDNIKSFWIFYEDGHINILSLHTKASFFPYVHIPIGKADPVKIREDLVKLVPEERQDRSIIDTIGRVLHI